MLPPILNSFRLARPDAELSLRIASTRAIEESLARNELDLGFVGECVERPELVSPPLVEAGLSVGVTSRQGQPTNGGATFNLLREAGLDLRRQLHVVRHKDKSTVLLADELTRAVLREGKLCRHDGQAHG